jgi:hypothetical protein
MASKAIMGNIGHFHGGTDARLIDSGAGERSLARSVFAGARAFPAHLSTHCREHNLHLR